MTQFTLSVDGTSPILMHSDRLADPLDPATRSLAAITGKKNKTEDDHREAGRREFIGSLYFDKDLGPYIPGQNMEACLFAAATKFRLGKALKSALLIPEEVNPLAYAGPRTIDEMWEDKNFSHRTTVKVTNSRVVRTRPHFKSWACEFTGTIDTDLIDKDKFESIVDIAGRLTGLGDWRPRFGRFEGKVSWA